MYNKYFVTGGTGFLGSYLLRLLVQDGRKVRAIRRASSRMDLVADLAEKVEWVECDVLDEPYLTEAMQGCQKVFHCAAIISYDGKDAKRMMQANAQGTANVVNAALDVGIEKLVHVSSIAALGKAKEGSFLDESAKWQPSSSNTAYSISKFLAEQEVWRGMAEGLTVGIVNPSIILGAGYWNEGSCELFSKVWKGLPFYTTGASGFVDVRDVAQAALLLMDSAVENERFIINGANLPFKDFFTTLAKAMDKKPPHIKVTPFLRELIWRLSSIQSFFGMKPFITKESAQQASRVYEYGGNKFAKKFNFSYRPIEQTIAQTADAFLQAQRTGKDYSVFTK